jgi:hypothetical protein
VKITPTGLFAILNGTVCAMLIKLYLVDHVSLKVLSTIALVSFILLNFTLWFGMRSKARRKARMNKQD